MPNQDGLEWVSTTFGLEPRWTKDPDIDIISCIARRHLEHNEEVPIEVSFHAQGAFNKLFRIAAGGPDYLLRVSLPVDPRLKTESEVATINFIRKETDMPVARIVAFDSDNQNELGFEWILMEMMPGTTLRNMWRKISWYAKETLVRQLAVYQSQLFAKQFRRIGNLFHSDNSTGEKCEGLQQGSESFVLGPIVSLVFFWGDHLTHDVSRGPFDTSHDWLQSRLEFVRVDQELILKASDDEDDIEDAEFTKELAGLLTQAIPDVFSARLSEAEPSVLFHNDLSMQNILVDGDGKLTAVIDWECVSAVPLWRACQFPQFLEGRARDDKPVREEYAPDSEDERREVAASPDALGSESVNELYCEHLLEYEQTLLRRVFMECMESLTPDWNTTLRKNTLQVDFELAVHNCDNGWRFKSVKRWLTAFKEGHAGSLNDALME
ncbi:kinase-like protein [Clathrospora elynae]|uniref:Kinase-like protein n=1 Tax=Clathrospora elynae TaxID=706981 RepID=A0A6A5SI06_9PLEO|nr:kinase-like protein [Clathrospora elynae]